MEKGWRVFSADGTDIGKVADIRGEIEADIFHGITVKRGLLGKPEYVSADRVAQIFEGEVMLAP
jgi:uncharacterized protein YrrD